MPHWIFCNPFCIFISYRYSNNYYLFITLFFDIGNNYGCSRIWRCIYKSWQFSLDWTQYDFSHISFKPTSSAVFNLSLMCKYFLQIFPHSHALLAKPWTDILFHLAFCFMMVLNRNMNINVHAFNVIWELCHNEKYIIRINERGLEFTSPVSLFRKNVINLCPVLFFVVDWLVIYVQLYSLWLFVLFQNKRMEHLLYSIGSHEILAEWKKCIFINIILDLHLIKLIFQWTFCIRSKAIFCLHRQFTDIEHNE